jgi:hypothetical protein
MLPTDEWAMPMAIPMYGLGLPALGSYYFSVRIDGREMDRSSFRLVLPEPPEVEGTDSSTSTGQGGGAQGRPIAEGPAV